MSFLQHAMYSDAYLVSFILQDFDDIETVQITCPTVTKESCSDGYDPIKLPGECCEKCASKSPLF